MSRWLPFLPDSDELFRRLAAEKLAAERLHQLAVATTLQNAARTLYSSTTSPVSYTATYRWPPGTPYQLDLFYDAAP